MRPSSTPGLAEAQHLLHFAAQQHPGPVRLAGRSLFCSENTCHGLSQDRELYVDVETGNVYIGFCMLREP